MPGLIEEIQREAMDPAVAVSTLLRKVKVAASKLNLSPTETWVEHELNGYPAGVEIPEYRELHGKPMALNPYRGWIPIILGNDDLDRMLSTCPVSQSIASMEAILRENKTSFVQFPLSPGMITHLNELTEVRFGTMAVHIPTGSAHGLLDAVRNAVLEWALRLEQAGVNGEGLSFSREEKQAAKEVSTTINIGSIGSMVGNLGSHNTSGDISGSHISVDQVRDVTEQLEPHVISLKAAGANARMLDASLAELGKQSSCARPDPSILRSALIDLRNALSGAAGSLIASGAITIISKMLGG
ncbi:hypothetical protein [Bradyrhizobium sp. 188]|uniref:AbiTii domain-containing protein n=1 Tax=Bradyrhizobium sp. 188 TaxID=2782656 RepID=UPI001FF7DE14|nr:hypothetical protein [Bradyrhizobium sp. 188]MCK1497993.1 hypothetical protein [Bradyrhizobium sp. 188]